MVARPWAAVPSPPGASLMWIEVRGLSLPEGAGSGRRELDGIPTLAAGLCRVVMVHTIAEGVKGGLHGTQVSRCWKTLPVRLTVRPHV